jgi:hypothetical protein
MLRRDEAKLVLELAAEAAHVSEARQYARLAACLAGRAAAGQTREGRIRVLEGAVKTASSAGGAGGDLVLDLDF